MTNEIVGMIVVKSIKEDLKSISTGNKTELKVRFTGSVGLGDKSLASIEALVIKGDPDEVRKLMDILSLDTIDESTKISLHKNLQARLDEEDE